MFLLNLLSFFDSTQGSGDPSSGSYMRILDAIYDSGDPDNPEGVAIFTGRHGDQLTYGSIYHYGTPLSLSGNPEPYGFWLVRDSSIKVSEPSTLLLIIGSLCLLGFSRKYS